jgi:site-specific DNA-cytosine methylase
MGCVKIVLELNESTRSLHWNRIRRRALKRYGFKVDSLDIDPSCKATWTSDILEWDTWRHMTPGRYDFIWASPPCTEYSIARTTAKNPRNFELADSIVERTLEIIRELAPKAWLLENPQTGYLKSRPFMQGYPFRDVAYCRYLKAPSGTTGRLHASGESCRHLCQGPCVHGGIPVS